MSPRRPHYVRLWVGLALCLLLADGLLARSLGRRGSTAAPRVGASQPQSTRTAQLEEATLREINRARKANRLSPLDHDVEIAKFARAHSRDMIARDYFDHVTPEGRSLIDRIRGADVEYRLAGENLYKSVGRNASARSAVDAWLKSPGHRKNLLRPEFTHTGLGIWQSGRTWVFTQVLLRRP